MPEDSISCACDGGVESASAKMMSGRFATEFERNSLEITRRPARTISAGYLRIQ